MVVEADLWVETEAAPDPPQSIKQKKDRGRKEVIRGSIFTKDSAHGSEREISKSAMVN